MEKHKTLRIKAPFKIGDILRCVNADGWEGFFAEGEEFTVTQIKLLQPYDRAYPWIFKGGERGEKIVGVYYEDFEAVGNVLEGRNGTVPGSLAEQIKAGVLAPPAELKKADSVENIYREAERSSQSYLQKIEGIQNIFGVNRAKVAGLIGLTENGLKNILLSPAANLKSRRIVNLDIIARAIDNTLSLAPSEEKYAALLNCRVTMVDDHMNSEEVSLVDLSMLDNTEEEVSRLTLSSLNNFFSK